MFHELKTISLSKSQWIFTFFIDLQPFRNVIDKSQFNIRKVRKTLYNVIRYYDKPNAHIEFRSYSDLIKKQKGEINQIEKDLKTITKLYHNLQDFNANNEDDNKETTINQKKRSILPFVGNIFHFLFGTVTDKNLGKVKDAIRTLASQQNSIKHVIKENLSIINITRSEIQENRHTINGLINSIEMTNSLFSNITTLLQRKLVDVNYFLSVYLQADILIQQMHKTNQRALTYINTINQQLNAFATGHITQSVIPPQKLKEILLNISRQLPDTMKLPQNIETNLWFYYRYLRCTLLTREKKFLIIASVHINDVAAKFTIFQILNIPVGYSNVSSVAYYKH